jgi:hypothetical protein
MLGSILLVVSLLGLVLAGLLGKPARIWPRAAIGMGAAVGAAIAIALLGHAGTASWESPARAQTVLSGSGLDVKQLWQAQPQLMAKELASLQAPVAGRANVYAIAIAAQGSSPLFSREAQLALQVAAARFAGAYRGGVLLSNEADDLPRHPLATRDSVAQAARGIAGKIDANRDVALIYLASHGSPEAWISTDLPTRRPLPPISSASVAEALAEAGIKRRVVIVSACFAASWIPALASDDTIVITAAAKDRTSFGCDDSRRLTFFGEAFLEGPLARGASLRDAFDAARGSVTKWEAVQEFVPSMPLAYIGRNMQALWAERAGTARARK